MPTEIQYGGLSWGFVGKLPLIPFYLSQGNRRFVTPYILLSSLLLIIFYLGGLIMRGLVPLSRLTIWIGFSNGSPSLIRVARDSYILWQNLSLALAFLYSDFARDPVGNLWRYFITLPPFLGYWSLSSAQSMLRVWGYGLLIHLF